MVDSDFEGNISVHKLVSVQIILEIWNYDKQPGLCTDMSELFWNFVMLLNQRPVWKFLDKILVLKHRKCFSRSGFTWQKIPLRLISMYCNTK